MDENQYQNNFKYIPVLFSFSKNLRWASPIGLVGHGLSSFFSVIFEIWADNRGGTRELQLRVGAGVHVLRGWDAGVARETEWDRDLNCYLTSLIVVDQRKNRKLAETNLLCV